MKIKKRNRSLKNLDNSLSHSDKEFLKEKYSYYLIHEKYEFLNEVQKDYLRMLSLMEEF